MTLPDYPKILIDDKGVGDTSLSERIHVRLGALPLVVNGHGVFHLLGHRVDKPLYGIGLLAGYTDNGDLLVLVLGLNLRQVRDAGATRRTPRGREIHHGHLVRLQNHLLEIPVVDLDDVGHTINSFPQLFHSDLISLRCRLR